MEVRNLDVARPKIQGTEFIHGSILDRQILSKATEGVSCVVHIAAWHGIHEAQGNKTVYEFHDLNVTGTFNVLEASVQHSVKNFLFVSSTSVDNQYSVYGHTKILGEEMCRSYAERHKLRIMILRPRAFIPSWNRTVYSDYIAWAKWFMKGAVHIFDVKQAVIKSISSLTSQMTLNDKVPVLVIDGAYEYTAEDLDTWDKNGEGSTFKKYYEDLYALAMHFGLTPAQKPKILDISTARALIGYEPQYSLRSLLEELKQYGTAGPPPPSLIQASLNLPVGHGMRTIWTSIETNKPIGTKTYITEEEAYKMRKHPNVDAALLDSFLVAVEQDRWALPDERYFISGERGSKVLRRAGLDQWAEVAERQEEKAYENALNSY
jgi:nucleoside-diphosphate-sugar epimerase